MTATFSEEALGFTQSNLHLVRPGGSKFRQVDATTCNFDVTPAGDNPLVIRVPAGAVIDASGNLNEQSNLVRVNGAATAPEFAFERVDPGSQQGTFVARFQGSPTPVSHP